jgi:hypothetical protein
MKNKDWLRYGLSQYARETIDSGEQYSANQATQFAATQFAATQFAATQFAATQFAATQLAAAWSCFAAYHRRSRRICIVDDSGGSISIGEQENAASLRAT